MFQSEYPESKECVEDKVNQPSHYKFKHPDGTEYELIHILEAARLGEHLFSALQYIFRCQKKGHEIQDIDKAIWYLNRYKEYKKIGSSDISPDPKSLFNTLFDEEN